MWRPSGKLQIMGILNVTPDSFSDGGRYAQLDAALWQVENMLQAGADIIDIGGESTRPNAATDVPEEEELQRVLPVIAAIRQRFEVPMSIDTSKPNVMREAVAAGVDLINDVCALRVDGALDVCAQLDVPICLMHMQGVPRSMQHDPMYSDVVTEVSDFFQARIQACEAAGVARSRLILDPGFGFGKNLMHNLALLKNLARLADFNLPILIGISRKSMIGALLDNAPVEQRLYGSIAAAVIAALNGASIIRVHDVKATVDALTVTQAVLDYKN